MMQLESLRHAQRKVYPLNIHNPGHIEEDRSVHSRTQWFVNRSGSQMVVTDRHNTPVILPPAPVGSDLVNPGVDLCTRYNFHGYETLRRMGEVMSYMKNVTGTDGQDRGRIRVQMDSTPLSTTNPYFSIVVTRTVPLKDIVDEKIVFDQGSGFMVSLENNYLHALHPESVEARMAPDYKDYVVGNPTGFLIEIIDNESQYGDRYMYSGNNVIRIPSFKNKERPSGVYVSVVEEVGSGRTENKGPVHYDMDMATELYGLFKTHEEALTGGNPKLLTEERLLNQKRDFETVKQEFEKRRSELELENLRIKSEYSQMTQQAELRLKEELQKMELERKRMEAEADRRKEEFARQSEARKDYYEGRSYERKDHSEWLKIGGALVTGALAVFLFKR